MKIRSLTPYNAFYPVSHTDFLKKQFTCGLPLSFFGLFVYGFLRLIGKKAHNYHGLCKYFMLGKDWGGFSMGFFFVCGRENGESTKAHEFGHCIANASVGGFAVLGCSIASAVRYWRYTCNEKRGRVNKPYDEWWFEKQATELGAEHQNRLKQSFIRQNN